ncbi:MAG: glycosyltransferase [Pyrinomonadaceae bacterium]
MNILLIPSVFPTRREPWPGSYVYEYARSLALHHNVTVVYPQQLGSPLVGDTPFFTEEWLEPRVRFINYTYSHLSKSWIFSYLGAFRKVWRRIQREWKIDIIHAHIVMPAGLSALMLKGFFRIPVVLTEHWGPVTNWIDEAPVPQKLQYRTLKYAFHKADYLTAVSESLAGEIKEVFNASVDGKLDYPIDCELFHPNENALTVTAPRVLCVTRGRFDPRKGMPNLFAAWELVSRRTGGGVYLDMVGPDLELLMPQIEALGIGQTVRLLPWRPVAELAPLMRDSALVVIPSSYETFGRSGAEALASGVPVVATRCGGPEEYVEQGTGLLVPKEDPHALAEGIIAGLNRRDFLPPEELARRTRARFGYEAICRRFTEVATELISKRSH